MPTLILPMYNESSSIPLLRTELERVGYASVYKVIAVNDGSKDNTLELLMEWRKEEPKLDIVTYTPNKGLPGAVMAGFKRALEVGDDIFVTMDSDASHPVSLIPSMEEKIKSGYDIVIASRHQEGAGQQGLSFVRKLYSWGASTLMNLFYPLEGVRDYSTNFRAYRASLIKKAMDYSGDSLVESKGFVGVVELLLRLCSLGPKICEVPLDLRYDLKVSESKMKVGKTIRGYLQLLPAKKIRSSTGTCLPLRKTM